MYKYVTLMKLPFSHGTLTSNATIFRNGKKKFILKLHVQLDTHFNSSNERELPAYDYI